MNHKVRLSFLVMFFILFLSVTWVRREGMFSRDGVVFLGLADLVKEGHSNEALKHPHHPLTYVAIAQLWSWGVDPVLAGKGISVLSLAVLLGTLLFYIKRKFNFSIALWSVLWMILTPQILTFSTDILSDPLYWLGIVVGTVLLSKSIDDSKLFLSFVAGLMFSLSFHARPEGFVMAGGMCGVLVIKAIFRQLKFSYPILFIFGFLLSASIYMMQLHEVTGEWRFSRKVNFMALSGLDNFVQATTSGEEVLHVPGFKTESMPSEYDRGQVSEKFKIFFSEHVGSLFETLWYPQLAILIFGFYFVYKNYRKTSLFFMVLLIQLIIIEFQWFDDHYLSKRHWGLVALVLGMWVGPVWCDLFKKLPHKFLWLFFALSCLVVVEKQGKFFSSEKKRRSKIKVAYRELGEQLQNRSESYFVCRDARTAWFAGNKKYIQWPTYNDPFVVIDKAREKFGADDHVVIVPLRRTHRDFELEKILERLRHEGYVLVSESDLEMAFALTP